MRFLPAIALLLAPLAGCALNGGLTADPLASRAGMLNAWIQPNMSAYGPASYTVYTSHDAHIAVFEVVPGRGIGLVYPNGRWQSSYATAGLRRIIDIAPTYRMAYAGTATFSSAGPRYMVLVASERPLRVDALRESDFALRRAMHFQTFQALNPQASIDALVNMIVPLQQPAGWDVDVYAIWPQTKGPNREVMVHVVCPRTGSVFGVPRRYANALRMQCSQPANTTVAVGPGDDDNEVDDDDDEIVDDLPPRVVEGPKKRSGSGDGASLRTPVLPRRPMVAIGDDDEDDEANGPAFWPPTHRPTVEQPRPRRGVRRAWPVSRRPDFDWSGPDRSMRAPRVTHRTNRARPTSPPTFRRATPTPRVRTPTRPRPTPKKSSDDDKKKKKKKNH